MKKIIAVTAGLMLAGTIAASASAAEITFSGDARARYNYEDNYNGLAGGAGIHSTKVPVNQSDSFWNSRIRLQFQINTKGGAYAVGRFRLADGTWEGNTGSTVNPPGGGGTGGSVAYAATNTKSNIWVDVGYVGVPMGPVVLEGGLGYDDFTNDFLRAGTTDNFTFLRAKYATDQTTLYAFYEKLRVDPLLGDATYTDGLNNVNQYGIDLIQKFNSDWSMNGTVLYRDDQQTAYDYSGAAADILVNGKLPNDIKIWAELAYKQADYQAGGYYNNAVNSAKEGWSNKSTTGDDGWGGYVAAKFPLGNGVAISAMAGASLNGYTASPDFGGGKQAEYAPFVMLSQPTTKDLGFLGTGVLIGSPDGDAYFVNVAPSVQASDRLTLTLEGTYMNADYGRGAYLGNNRYVNGINSLNIWEIGGIAQYKVTDGATISAMLGYLNIEDADNNPLGFGVSLDLKF
ncbi:MAG: hypothetical protein LBH14_05450 [Desulfobulbaceae bacterium]|nr:hypothetical protein [Desulfobulbaceae bacterium]